MYPTLFCVCVCVCVCVCGGGGGGGGGGTLFSRGTGFFNNVLLYSPLQKIEAIMGGGRIFDTGPFFARVRRGVGEGGAGGDSCPPPPTFESMPPDPPRRGRTTHAPPSSQLVPTPLLR